MKENEGSRMTSEFLRGNYWLGVSEIHSGHAGDSPRFLRVEVV